MRKKKRSDSILLQNTLYRQIIKVTTQKTQQGTSIYVYVPHFYDLSALVGCWSTVSIRRIIYKFLNVCPFDYTAVAVSGKVERS